MNHLSQHRLKTEYEHVKAHFEGCIAHSEAITRNLKFRYAEELADLKVRCWELGGHFHPTEGPFNQCTHCGTTLSSSDPVRVLTDQPYQPQSVAQDTQTTPQLPLTTTAPSTPQTSPLTDSSSPSSNLESGERFSGPSHA